MGAQLTTVKHATAILVMQYFCYNIGMVNFFLGPQGQTFEWGSHPHHLRIAPVQK